MAENSKRKKKVNIKVLDQTSIIQLLMLILTIIIYGVFLSVQQFLFPFEGLRNKIIIINVLLAVGLIVEIGYFVWEVRKKQKKTYGKHSKENRKKTFSK
jgi:type VI protein secretion system component VasK